MQQRLAQQNDQTEKAARLCNFLLDRDKIIVPIINIVDNAFITRRCWPVPDTRGRMRPATLAGLRRPKSVRQSESNPRLRQPVRARVVHRQAAA